MKDKKQEYMDWFLSQSFWPTPDKQFDWFISNASQASSIPTEVQSDRTEYYNQLTKNLGKTQDYHYTGPKCVAGCKRFTAYETKHHPDCPFYPNSLSEKYDKHSSFPTEVQKEEWISIDVDLPQTRIRVLATLDIGEMTIVAFLDLDGSWKSVEWDFVNDYSGLSKVTHWMKLPSYPNKVLPAASAPPISQPEIKDKIMLTLIESEERGHRNVGEGCNYTTYILPKYYQTIVDKIATLFDPISHKEDEKLK